MLHSPLTPFFLSAPHLPPPIHPVALTTNITQTHHLLSQPPTLTLGLLREAPPHTQPGPQRRPHHQSLKPFLLKCGSTAPPPAPSQPHTANKDKSPSLPRTDRTWASAPKLGALILPSVLKQPCLLETSVPKTCQVFSDSRAMALCSV